MRSDRFVEYLTEAVEAALERAAGGEDEGELWYINELCRRGVNRNWGRLNEREFLKGFLYVVGAIQRPTEQRERYYPLQVKLFRGCLPRAILRDRALILDEWQSDRHNLNRRMLDAILAVSYRIASEGWETFKRAALPLPADPESEDPHDWRATYTALDALPMIGEANVWFMLRNLLGAPFLKPDVHIKAIASNFFGTHRDPVAALAAEVRASWAHVCRERRLRPVHLGEIDYILWDYRMRTGRPVDSG